MAFSKRDVIRLAPAAQVFYDNLFENHEVCSYCFQQIREIEPIDDKRWGSRLASHPTEYRTIADGGEPGHDCHQHDEYGAIKTYHSRTFCGDCGRNGLSDDSHQKLTTLLAFGRNIVRELDRQGIDCDLDALRDSLRRSSEHRQLQGYQTEILALATAQGVATAGARTRCQTDD
jgi:hypothetical protein